MDWSLFSAPERAVLMAYLASGGDPELLARLAKARRRSVLKADSDAWTDSMRRRLVGARVPIGQAVKYRICAQEHNLSLYRFVCNALEREYKRLYNLSI